MDKRLAKRHKRQVERAKEKVRVSEPDVRTHEQIEAAREASRSENIRGTQPKAGGSAVQSRASRAPLTGSSPKTAT